MDTCKGCFKTSEVVPVQIRRNRDDGWTDSSIIRCANDDCWEIRGGSDSDKLIWINNVYGYKYFGDYELSPEQQSAVWTALYLATKNA